MLDKQKNKIRGFEKTKEAENELKLPQRGTKNSAGYDFFAPEDIEIAANSFSDLIMTNIKLICSLTNILK